MSRLRGGRTREPREAREAKEVREAREAKEAREARETREEKAARRERAATNRGIRGVSTVVGFVLVFAILMTSIAVLYGSGVGTLEQARESEQVTNAERAMVALSENFGAIHRGRAPGRAGEIRLAGGTLTVNETSSFRLVVNRGGTVVQQDVGVGSLVYRLDDAAVWYEAGAVFRNGGESSVVAARPAFACNDERALVSTVTVRPASGSTSVGKQGTVVVVGRESDRSLVFPTDAAPQTDATDTTVRFEIRESANRDAWDRYLTENGWTKVGDDYECTTRRAYARRTVVSVAIRA
jgi:hypothetical protein